MRRTRRFVLLVIVASLLAVLLVPFLWYTGKQIYFGATQGKIVTIDGIRQNNRVYIKDAYYDAKEGIIRFTIVNNSSQNCYYEPDRRWIEKKVGDEWQICVDDEKFKTILEQPLDEPAHFYKAFFQSSGGIRVSDFWSEVTPGEYRIVINGLIDARTEEEVVGEFEVVEWSVSYPERGSCIVGYFTITEEMLP